jgi:hypothetical protein
MPVEFVLGEYFFHYTSREAAFGGILPDGSLRLSPYRVMRDPLENQHWRFTFSGSGPRDDTELMEDLARYDEFERRANNGIRDRSYLLSLTIDAQPRPDGEREPFCRGWARARMWEQYAEKHRGVCLVFDRERLADHFDRSVKNAGIARFYRRAVAYEGAGMLKPIIPHHELDDPDFLDRYIAANADSLFFTKTRDWETEHEFRFVAIAGDDVSLSVEYGDALVAVIAGEQLPAWERPAVESACQRVDAQALRILWKNWRPGLVELNPAE